jgi:hypothetical protein
MLICLLVLNIMLAAWFCANSTAFSEFSERFASLSIVHQALSLNFTKMGSSKIGTESVVLHSNIVAENSTTYSISRSGNSFAPISHRSPEWISGTSKTSLLICSGLYPGPANDHFSKILISQCLFPFRNQKMRQTIDVTERLACGFKVASQVAYVKKTKDF